MNWTVKPLKNGNYAVVFHGLNILKTNKYGACNNEQWAILAAAAPNLVDACKAAVGALNQIPNTKLTGETKDTYTVCSILEQVIAQATRKGI